MARHFKIGELYDNGHTINEIMAALGLCVGRSSVGRYVKQRDKLAKIVRSSREVSDSIVRDQDTGELSRDGAAALKAAQRAPPSLSMPCIRSLVRTSWMWTHMPILKTKPAKKLSVRLRKPSHKRPASKVFQLKPPPL
ncbi:hypothetical protein AA15669_1965 [Saccharibacter floricola DSM 15669]|uniref:Uncharacterized protein n=1 Tax=Saccharibacter floricola DSM 15669 TaxID=1123227 RepID=A0ABQ0P4N4_9PROT|nr:hypothetical protein AA15669_1965 [Saccharibacter floricola DSM 15669]